LVADIRRIADYSVERPIRLVVEKVANLDVGVDAGPTEQDPCLLSRFLVELNAVKVGPSRARDVAQGLEAPHSCQQERGLPARRLQQPVSNVADSPVCDVLG
jgi:hypothetical protein